MGSGPDRFFEIFSRSLYLGPFWRPFRFFWKFVKKTLISLLARCRSLKPGPEAKTEKMPFFSCEVIKKMATLSKFFKICRNLSYLNINLTQKWEVWSMHIFHENHDFMHNCWNLATLFISTFFNTLSSNFGKNCPS